MGNTARRLSSRSFPALRRLPEIFNFVRDEGFSFFLVMITRLHINNFGAWWHSK